MNDGQASAEESINKQIEELVRLLDAVNVAISDFEQIQKRQARVASKRIRATRKHRYSCSMHETKFMP